MKTIQNLTIAGKIGVAFTGVIVAFAISAGGLLCIREIDQKQKEIAASEDVLLQLKDGTADYLNIVWAVLANNLNGKPGHKEWISQARRRLRYPYHRLAVDRRHGRRRGAGRRARQQYDTWLHTVVNPLVDMRKKVDDFAVSVSDLSEMALRLARTSARRS